MAHVTQPLRDEHKELIPHIERLRTVADWVGEAPVATLRQGLAEAQEFLQHHLIPHAEAEERVLYPVVGRLLGTAEATATMSRDHVEVGRLTKELGALRTKLSGPRLGKATARALRRVLYGLYVLVKVHFAKEEEVYLALLDARLDAVAAREMFRSMEAAAGEAKARRRGRAWATGAVSPVSGQSSTSSTRPGAISTSRRRATAARARRARRRRGPCRAP